ncbi:MAG: 4-vinyl reductase [Bdellovibrionales bacterium]|nr:4-vinyl reductase [Bdellovibrionales bacterium]
MKCNLRIRNLLWRAQTQLGVSTATLSDILQLLPTDLDQVLIGRKELNIVQFSRLARFFNFSQETFFAGRLDFAVLAADFLKGTNPIPERYTRGAKSQIRAIKNIAKCLLRSHGEGPTNLFLRHFQISEAAWVDSDRPINVYFVEDALTLLRSWGLRVSQIEEIGKASTETAKGSEFAKRLSTYGSPKAMFENYIGEDIRLVEANNIYAISKLDEGECVFHSKENPELMEVFSGRAIGGKNRCHYRRGALAAATRYIGLPDSDVEETRCVHLGDEKCEFRVNFQWANFIWRQQIYETPRSPLPSN